MCSHSYLASPHDSKHRVHDMRERHAGTRACSRPSGLAMAHQVVAGGQDVGVWEARYVWQRVLQPAHAPPHATYTQPTDLVPGAPSSKPQNRRACMKTVRLHQDKKHLLAIRASLHVWRAGSCERRAAPYGIHIGDQDVKAHDCEQLDQRNLLAPLHTRAYANHRHCQCYAPYSRSPREAQTQYSLPLFTFLRKVQWLRDVKLAGCHPPERKCNASVERMDPADAMRRADSAPSCGRWGCPSQRRPGTHRCAWQTR